MEQIRSAFGRGAPEGSIYDILKSEHRQIKASLQEIINSGRIMKDIFNQTASALEMHMKGEETLLYPRFERYTNTRMLALRSFEEHHLAKMAINDINAAPEDDRWIAKIAVLYDVLNRHIDQEENEVFPNARKILTDAEAMQLGREYRTNVPASQPSAAPNPVEAPNPNP
jgi:hemerythrin superfamily protein